MVRNALAQFATIVAKRLPFERIGLAVDGAAIDALDCSAFRPLDWLALDPLRTFGALDPLTLDALRAVCPLDALAFDPLRTLGALDALAFDPLRAFGAFNALTLDPLGPLAFDLLRTLRALRSLRLALALARLCALATVIAIASRIGRACQRKAGDTGDEEKLAVHNAYSLNQNLCISTY